MIVLDTNQIDSGEVHGPLFSLLRAVAKSQGEILSISELALDEHLSHYRNKVSKHLDDYDRARINLEKLDAFQISPARREKDIFISRASRSREAYLRSIFRVIPMDGTSAIEGLRREAHRLPPASTDTEKPGTGGRDAAIWLSSLKRAKKENEALHFISADKRAFHKESIKDDAEEIGVQASIYFGIPDLLANLADKADADPAKQRIASSKEVKDYVASTLKERKHPEEPLAGALGKFVPRGTENTYYTFWNKAFDSIETIETFDPHSYSINSGHWTTMRVRWSISQTAKIAPGDNPKTKTANRLIVFKFEIITALLVGEGPKGMEVEVIDSSKPLRVSIEESHGVFNIQGNEDWVFTLLGS